MAAGGERSGALEIHLEQVDGMWRVERIRVERPDGMFYVRRRLEHWRSNVLTEVLAGVLAVLRLGTHHADGAGLGAEATGGATIRADGGEAERSLCARFYDLWHSPGKRIDTHRLHELFGEHPLWRQGYTSLQNILVKSGARRHLQIRLAEGFSADQVRFLERGRPIADGRLRAFARESFGVETGQDGPGPRHNLPRYRTIFVGRKRTSPSFTPLSSASRS